MTPKQAVVLALAAFVALGACGDDKETLPEQPLVQVTAASPFPAACNGPTQFGTNYRGAEVEPFVAYDPSDPMHLVGVWQQDRWSNGGANGLGAAASFDGGASWTTTFPRFSNCSGGDSVHGGNYERTSDPWVTITNDGTVYFISISFDQSNQGARNSVLAVQSTDGGRTWSDPTPLIADNDPDVFNDKESITADTVDGRHVYAVWDRLTGQLTPQQPIGGGPAWMARNTDGVWEPSRIIYDPGTDNQTISNIIAVLPDGTLIDVFYQIEMISSTGSPAYVAVVRSEDHGDTWSPVIKIAPIVGARVQDDAGVPVRTGGLPTIAVDNDSGAVYVAWEDGSFTQGAVDAVAMSTSLDGGKTWSAPARVNQSATHDAFTPGLAAANGVLTLTYYDLRANDDSDGSRFLASAWLAQSRDGGGSWTESALSEPFDLKQAFFGGVYFIGDYQGLAAAVANDKVLPFFAVTGDSASDPTDIFVPKP